MAYTYDDFMKTKEQADAGDVNALCELGYIYYYGYDGIQANLSAAVDCWSQASEQGDATAKNALGWCYRLGVGVPKNLDRAYQLIREAADLGNSDAQYMMGEFYYKGCPELYLDCEYTMAFLWYMKAAKQNHIDAALNLAYFYENGIGTQKDAESGVAWYKKCAELGNADAMNNLANCYSVGRGVERNYRTAAEYYKKAADKGNTFGLYNYANSLYWGEGVEQNYKEAFSYYMKAEKNDYIPAIFIIANMYYGGVGIKTDFAEAFNRFKLIASKNDPEYKEKIDSSLLMVGKCYYLGRGVDKDIDKAISCFKRCIEDDIQDPEAAYFLGEIYRLGESSSGIEKYVSFDYYEKAIEYYMKSTVNVQREVLNQSCYYVGLVYSLDEGVPRDMIQANKYWQIGTEGKDPDCCYKLAMSYLNGWGVQQDYDMAKKLLHQAASLGQRDAAALLNQMR